MKTERIVVAELWPSHAEMLTEDDWRVLSNAIGENRPIDDSIVEPHGEAKDAILASLTIVYWGLRIAHVSLLIAKETKGLEGKSRIEAIIEAVLKRVDENTTKVVTKQIRQVVETLVSNGA